MRHSRLYGIMTGMLYGMLVLSVSSCVKDDFDRYHDVSDALSFEVEVSGGWSEAASTSSTSIRRMSQSTDAEPLYLVTQVSDSAPISAESGVVTRGTPVVSADPMKTGGFGLSAICYTGTWPAEGSTNNWTTNFAHNLNVTMQKDGKWKTSEKLEWPGSGNIKFFAYYPHSENSDYISHSLASDKGAPVLTYTVPEDVKNQPDLLWAVADCPGKSTGDVKLEFQHALTAVTIKTGTDMLSGTITGVKISGVYGKGSCAIGGTTWTIPQDEKPRNFEITDLNVELLPTKKDDKNGLMINTGSDQGITSPELTFMMVPQTLPAGAKLTINFTDKLTNTARTLTADIGNTSWPAGKKVAYSINSTGIEVKTNFEFSKNPDIDIMPYSGVWYDATYKATVEVTQVGETKIINIPADKVKFQYKLENETDWTDWTDCTTDADGLLTIAPQSAYTEMRGKFDKESENGSMDDPFDLSGEKGEPANCYLVDKAGYYSLALVYGNGKNLTVPAGSTGLKYFPGYDDKPLPENGEITGAADAVLLWQDAPDLIDPNSVGIKDGKQLVFRIRKHTLTQGNAVLAVRKDEGGKKVIIWSWHIWVTPYKNDFYTTSCTSTTYLNMANKTEATKLREYEFAMYNLGWCDSHGHDDSRKFSLRAVVDMSAYGVEEPAVVSIPGEFTQMEYRGSDAGDNTYYQWGRKDPMLGGIHNSQTPKYIYYQKGTKYRDDEFNMENKQLFNQYNQDGYDYRFRKNVGDKLTERYPELDDENSHGVWIGYTIQHPYMFITNSRMQNASNEGGDLPQTDLGLNPDFNFRGHWHKPWALEPAPYLEGDTDRIMFNAWDAGALEPGKLYTSSNGQPNWGAIIISSDHKDEYLKTNASNVLKTVFDPCPPGFKVPPVDAFRGAESYSGSGNTRTITFGPEQSTVFPVTGMRNYALRSNEWTTVKPANGDVANFDHEAFYRTTMPAWSSVSFVSTATLVLKDINNRYQLFYFWPTTDGAISSLYTGTSSNSYGLSVRPIYSK